MTIGFDISQLAFHGGVVTYVLNLSRQLESLPDLKMKYFYSSLRQPYHGGLKNVHRFPIPISLVETMFNDWRLFPIDNLLGPMDVFHSSDWVQPKTKAKKITTYHDVIPLKYPQWSVPQVVKVHKRRMEIVVREIDLIIAVSETTKNDLINLYPNLKDRIRVIYEGVDEKFKPLPHDQVEAFRTKLKLPDKFLLAIGGVGERRNLDRLKQASGGYPLVISGQTIPWVSEEELPLLYNCAFALVYPSLYEGFGFPVIEAFACGTPVLTSNVSSLPEIGQSAALYTDPLNIEEMTHQIKEIMEDKDLRQNLREKGLKRAKDFSWNKCADETARLYNELANKNKL